MFDDPKFIGRFFELDDVRLETNPGGCRREVLRAGGSIDASASDSDAITAICLVAFNDDGSIREVAPAPFTAENPMKPTDEVYSCCDLGGLSATCVQALDQPYADRTHYQIEALDGSFATTIAFQAGTLPDHGHNGVTIESLLAICADRLAFFQQSNFACRENAVALTKIEEALLWLNARTAARKRRGVEGENVP